MPSGTSTLLFTLAYLAALVIVALFAARRNRGRGDPVDEHELGGRDLSFMVLLGTLYATQYSGNTLVGFPGKAARDGYGFFAAPMYMGCIVIGYLMFAPRLFALSRKHSFRTPGDLIAQRFDFKPLHALATLVMLFALLNYVLTQLVAIGRITEILGAGEGATAIHPAWGIVLLAFLMVIYETAGGMRAVAWTDLLQGLVLILGIAGLFVVLEFEFGGMGGVLSAYRENWPEKVEPPTGRRLATWIGMIFVLGVGGSLYPHAIQRVYAARSESVLKHSLATMAFLPLVTTLPMVIVGLKAQALYGDAPLSGDDAIPFLLSTLSAGGPIAKLVVFLVVAATVSAMMSTADSALLSTASIVNRDVLERYLLPNRSPRFYLRASKIISWVVVALLAAIAVWCVSKQLTLWAILSIKLELLMQLAPAVWFGVRGRRLSGTVAFVGMAAGVGVTAVLWILAAKAPWGLQAGVWGLGVNLVVCGSGVGIQERRQSRNPGSQEEKPGKTLSGHDG